MDCVLKNGGMTAITSCHGGELISLKNRDGLEYIWQGDPNYWSGQNPNLFPIVGSLKDGSIKFDGAAYHMNRHGFAQQSEFSIVEQGESHVVFQLSESESTLQLFPFRFQLRIRHQLLCNGFCTEFEIKNPGKDELPFCIGAHTAFNCPIKSGEHFSDYRLVFDQTENAFTLLPNSQGLMNRESREHILQNSDTIRLNHQVYEQFDTLIFEGLNSHGVSLINENRQGVHMDFSQFPMIAFWTNAAKKAPYICLEPWHGCPAFVDESGEFRDKHHCIQLQPGQTKTLSYTVTII